MYTVPNTFKTLVGDLSLAAGLNRSEARLLLYIELTLSLAIRLGLETEPLTIGWVLLSRMPLQHPVLNNLTPEQRRMRANAALIVPLSSRFAWDNALVQYARMPSQVRLYAVQPLPLDEQMIMLCRQEPCPDPLREERYAEILSATLSFEQRKWKQVEVGETYHVRVKIPDQGMRSGQVTIEPSMKPEASAVPWFDMPRPRTVITLDLEDLKPTAEFLDKREEQRHAQAHWVRDLEQIRYRRASSVDGQTILSQEGTDPLHLEGAVHLPGMVSAGKTTLAKLIIAHCIRMGWDVRITMVVGDSHTAIEMAHQVNNWFYDNPAGDDVVAVPLLGASQREKHLGRLLASREYARSLKHGQPHWGERWLMPVCPLASKIQWEANQHVIIPAGAEPCEQLIKPRDKHVKGERAVCPLFHHCPAKQMYRDMPRARLWVTTPGALSQAALPLHLDQRILKMGDLVYEQSDLVILDEVETIVDWYDRTFAQHQDLTNGKNGLLDRLDRQITEYWSSNRVLPASQYRWVIAVRESLKALSGILAAIADDRQERAVKIWIRRGYFSPNQLAFRLARRLAGLKEWDSARTLPDERNSNTEITDSAFAPFRELLNRIIDPLRQANYVLPAAAELAQLMQSINNLAGDSTDEEIFSQCRAWILRNYPDVEMRLAQLKARLQQSDDKYDKAYLNEQFDRSVDELAQRLRFLLMVALLDRHMHIIIQEWHNRPETLDAEQPFSRIPRGMRNILPLPLTGQQYGFAKASVGGSTETRNHLSLFAYTNIGRSYLLDFNKLRQDLEGTAGPNVLALSGTSYLPDSTAFHVTLPPAGILLAPDKTVAAIQESRFIWKYFVDDDGEPIFISGKKDKDNQLRRLMQAMLTYGGTPGGFLKITLDWLEEQGRLCPEQWEDRARILLLTNSYSQAQVAAQSLRAGWRDAFKTIFNLKRGGGGEDYEVEMEIESNTLKRIDIERFAELGGRILIAPMQSIGRGFNILNNAPEPKAAFGAVFFLTRPLNPPNEMEAMAQELNRYALEWAANQDFGAWAEATLYERALKARDCAMDLRRLILNRYGYEHLIENATLGMYPRRDMAATTAGRIVQAVGRLLRGGVPFRAWFVDAAWSPVLANTGDEHQLESEETSLLTALINVLSEYADRDEIGKQLYSGFAEALITTENRDSN